MLGASCAPSARSLRPAWGAGRNIGRCLQTFCLSTALRKLFDPLFDAVFTGNVETFFSCVLVSATARHDMFNMTSTEDLRAMPSTHTIAVARWEDDGGAPRSSPLDDKTAPNEQCRSAVKIS